MFKEVTTMFLKKHIKNVTQLPKKLFKKVNVFQRNIGIHGSNQVHTKTIQESKRVPKKYWHP